MKKVFLVAIGLGCLSLGDLKAQFVVPGGTVTSTNLFTNGNVGIGFASSTTAPSAKLHLKTGDLLVENGLLRAGAVVGTDNYWMNFSTASVLFKVGYNGATMGSLYSDIRFFKAGYLNVRNNDFNINLGAVSGLSGASLKSDGNLNLFAGSSNLVLGTSTTERLRIDGATGFIGINTGAVAPAYNLDVNGTAKVSSNLTLGAGLTMTGKLVIGGAVTNAIYANDAAVKMTVQGTIVSKRIVCATPAWADFVFDKNYKLESLSDVEKYIAINKHLPGIPSADELVNTGIDPAELLKLQMMKIEELTLYLIAQQKQIDVLLKK